MRCAHPKARNIQLRSRCWPELSRIGSQTNVRRIGRALINVLPPSFEVCRWPFIYKDCNDEGVVSYPEACKNAIYAQQTTFDAYLNARFTSHSFTLETPMGWPLEKRVQAHLIWLGAAMSRLRAINEGRDGGQNSRP